MTTYTGTSGPDTYVSLSADEDAFYLLEGDDRLTLWSDRKNSNSFSVDAGSGNDFVSVAGAGHFIPHAGSLYYSEGLGSFTITTGPGSDTVQPYAYRVKVTDFDPASDRIDLGLSGRSVFPGSETYQVLVDGADTVLVHVGGVGQIRLLNVSPASLNTTNVLNATLMTTVLAGSSGPDVLSGTSLAEQLVGGGGNNSLTGGGGRDLFFFNGRTDGVDQIHDFKSGEDVIGLSGAGFGISAAPLRDYAAGGSFSPSDTLFFKGALNGQLFPNPTVVYDPASYTITWVQSATANSSGAVTYDSSVLARVDPGATTSWGGSTTSGVAPANTIVSGVGTFSSHVPANSVVLRDPSTGHVELRAVLNQSPFDLGYSKGPAWTLAAIADIDGDGISDILWRNIATSQVDDWRMKDNNWAGSVDLGASKGKEWQLAATGDFNGDGTDDVLWRNTDNGQVDQWQMKNANWSQSVDLGIKSQAWTVADVGDFNGDGTTDILWRNLSTGQVDEWQMRDGNWSRSTDLGSGKGANWEIAAIADLNGNGTDDILWRDLNTGQTDAWIMRDGNWAGSAAIGPRDTAFHAIGTSQLVDGVSVVWHNPTTGLIDTWTIVPSAPTHPYDYMIT